MEPKRATDEIYEHWREYRVDIDIKFEEENTRIKERFVLKEKFFSCLLKNDILVFVMGGAHPMIYKMKCDEEYNCLLKFPDGEWGIIGKFVKI